MYLGAKRRYINTLPFLFPFPCTPSVWRYTTVLNISQQARFCLASHWLVAGCSHHPLQLDQRKKGQTIAVQRNAEVVSTADVAVTEAN